jgi:cytochrome c-type protein NapB
VPPGDPALAGRADHVPASTPAGPGAPQVPPARPLAALAAAIVAVAAIGFFTGTRGSEPPASRRELQRSPVPTRAPVPTYEQIGARRRGPNERMYDDAFAALQRDLPARTAPVERTGDLDAALRQRASRRAYDGAPPTVPHPINQGDAPSCLACHEHGAIIAGRLAPAMSHARHDSCVQCHVSQVGPPPAGPRPPPANDFAGLQPTPHGTRAWAGAPPTIPHTLSMRSRCDSCHGVAGVSPIRSTHPWRQSCQQCHVPAAATLALPGQFPPRANLPQEDPPWTDRRN